MAADDHPLVFRRHRQHLADQLASALRVAADHPRGEADIEACRFRILERAKPAHILDGGRRGCRLRLGPIGLHPFENGVVGGSAFQRSPSRRRRQGEGGEEPDHQTHTHSRLWIAIQRGPLSLEAGFQRRTTSFSWRYRALTGRPAGVDGTLASDHRPGGKRRPNA